MMETAFQKAVRTAKIAAMLHTGSSLGIVIFFILGIALWQRNRSFSICLLALMVVCCCILGVLCKSKLSVTGNLYKFPIYTENFDEVLSAMGASVRLPDLGYVEVEEKGFHLRCLIKNHMAGGPLKEELSDARKRIKGMAPAAVRTDYYYAVRMIRMEVLVCSTPGTEMAEWLSKNFAHNMSRTESILRVCIATETGECCVPMDIFGLDSSELRKYLCAVEFLKRMVRMDYEQPIKD